MNPAAARSDGQPEMGKKPYAKPSLQVFGGVLELTHAHGTMATAADGATTGGTGMATSKTN